MPRVGHRSSADRLARLDRRTREAKLALMTRQSLLDALGRDATPGDRMLIESIVQIQLRLSMMDRDLALSGVANPSASKVYLAHAASQSRLLRQLGIKPQSKGQRTLADIERDIMAQKQQASAA